MLPSRLGIIELSCCFRETGGVAKLVRVKSPYLVEMVQVVGKEPTRAWYLVLADTRRLHGMAFSR